MKRTFWIAVASALVFVLGYLASLTVRIARQSTVDEARPADVIIVMGAAEYRGTPSPVLRARLDHALLLYRRHFAPRILTTGGAGGDHNFTEGGVGRSYLIDRGVPSEAIMVEEAGGSTVYSISAASEILQRMGLKSCILVSDGYHIFRTKRMLWARGLEVFGSPRESTGQSEGREWWLYIRQAIAFALWKIGITV
ncbi:MAG: YdcF family protein [Acidobacteriota bacterium]|nr:YdcF family protein [Acidobacteriota bacterium]